MRTAKDVQALVALLDSADEEKQLAAASELLRLALNAPDIDALKKRLDALEKQYAQRNREET